MPGLVVFSVLLLYLVAPGLQQEDTMDGQKKDCSENVFCIPDSYDVSQDDKDFVGCSYSEDDNDDEEDVEGDCVGDGDNDFG